LQRYIIKPVLRVFNITATAAWYFYVWYFYVAPFTTKPRTNYPIQEAA